MGLVASSGLKHKIRDSLELLAIPTVVFSLEDLSGSSIAAISMFDFIVLGTYSGCASALALQLFNFRLNFDPGVRGCHRILLKHLSQYNLYADR